MFTITYDKVPTFVIVGRKKYYLTYNAIYSCPNFRIRSSIKNTMKSYLIKELNNITLRDKDRVSTLKALFEEKQLIFSILYSSGKRTFDLDNRAGLWAKVFLDLIKGRFIKDDSVKYVTMIQYGFDYCKGASLDSFVITIEIGGDAE